MFASGSGDRKILLFDTSTLTKVKDLSESKNTHTGTIISLNWVSDERLLTASLDKTCKLWDVKTSTVLATMAVKKDKLEVEDMNAACGSFSGEMLISVTLDGKINIWNAADLKADEVNLPKRIVEGHKGSITAMCCNSKHATLVSGDSEGIVCIWNGYSAKSVKLHNGNITALKEAADGTIYVAGTYSMLYKIGAETNIELSLKLDSSPIQIAPSTTDPSTVYVLLSNGTLAKVTGKEIKQKYKAPPNSTALEINEVDGEIYIGDKKGLIHIYSMKDFTEVGSVTEYTNEITYLSYHQSTKRLAATDRLKLLYLYDIGARKLIGNAMSGHCGAVWNCCWSPSGEFLATASLDFSVTVWNTLTKPCQKINIERMINQTYDNRHTF